MDIFGGIIMNELLLKKHQAHQQICNKLHTIYVNKSQDYGDSFGETYRKLGIISALTRIYDQI